MLTLSVVATALVSSLALISLGGGLYEFRVVDPTWPAFARCTTARRRRAGSRARARGKRDIGRVHSLKIVALDHSMTTAR
jgi:hypothetical protein